MCSHHTDKGNALSANVEDVSQTGRAALGVRLMRMEDESKVAAMAVIRRNQKSEEVGETAGAEDTTRNNGRRLILALN